MGHGFQAQVRSKGLAGAALCDLEYPPRVAFALLAKMQDDFMSSYGADVWINATEPLELPFLSAAIEKHQNLHDADSITQT